MKIINFKNKKTKLLAKKQLESYKNAKISYICVLKIKEIRGHCHYTGKY